MLAAHWYRRRWDALRDDRDGFRRTSTWFLETTRSGQVLRRIEVNDGDVVKRYDASSPSEGDGASNEADITPERWGPYAITQAIFEAAWRPDEYGAEADELLEFVEVSSAELRPVRSWLLEVPADADFEPVWSGLWEGEYPASDEENPFLAYGIGDTDGELFHLLRAIAWAACGPRRVISPRYHLEEAVEQLGVHHSQVLLATWEYELDQGEADLPTADHGYVVAQADMWPAELRSSAGLFPLDRFTQLSAVDVAVADGPSSEITLYGLKGTSAAADLAATLTASQQPTLSGVLDVADTVVHLSQSRDDHPRGTSRLLVRSRSDLEPLLTSLTAAARASWTTYLETAPTFRSWDDFHAAIRALTHPIVDPDGTT